jgi:NADPH:quinone reductase
MVAGDYLARNLDILASDGRLVIIAFLHGAKAEIDFSTVLRRRLLITGSGLRPRPVAEKGAIADGLRSHVWPLLAAGKVKPVIDKIFPLAEAAAAHRLMESSTHIGKIVLRI